MWLLVSLIALGGALLWFFSGARRNAEPRGPGGEIDRAELEAAEKEVQQLGIDARPEPDEDGEDWGPGASRDNLPPL